MANLSNKGIILKRGILGSMSGSYNNVIISKNGVIRSKVLKNTRKKRKK